MWKLLGQTCEEFHEKYPQTETKDVKQPLVSELQMRELN